MEFCDRERTRLIRVEMSRCGDLHFAMCHKQMRRKRRKRISKITLLLFTSHLQWRNKLCAVEYLNMFELLTVFLFEISMNVLMFSIWRSVFMFWCFHQQQKRTVGILKNPLLIGWLPKCDKIRATTMCMREVCCKVLQIPGHLKVFAQPLPANTTYTRRGLNPGCCKHLAPRQWFAASSTSIWDSRPLHLAGQQKDIPSNIWCL